MFFVPGYQICWATCCRIPKVTFGFNPPTPCTTVGENSVESYVYIMEVFLSMEWYLLSGNVVLFSSCKRRHGTNKINKSIKMYRFAFGGGADTSNVVIIIIILTEESQCNTTHAEKRNYEST